MARRVLEPTVLADLREVHLGDWEGGEYRRRMHERDPIAMQALMEERWDVIPGAESMESRGARVAVTLDELEGLARLQGGRGAVADHDQLGGVARDGERPLAVGLAHRGHDSCER